MTDTPPPRRRRTLVVAAVLVAAVLGGGAFGVGTALGSAAEPGALPVASTPTATATPALTPTATARPTAEAAAEALRTCSVAGLAADPRLGSMQARVVDAATGEVLFDRGGGTASRTASALKILTAASALAVLGPDTRIATTVVRGSEPGSVVLVGGGDLTLTRLPTGRESTYAGAAHLDDLAAQVESAWEADPSTAGTPITSLVLDSSLYSGETWQPSWNRKEQVDGYMPEITALQVDGDREDPTASTSERGTDPVGRAGEAFADELDGSPVVSTGTAPAGAAVLGTVESAPVGTLVQQMLLVSDNAIAEMLARLVAIRTGAGSDFAAEQAGVLQGLAGYGVDTSGIAIVDGSGLSDDNAVAPAYFTELLRKVQAREGQLGILLDGLPVSGRTGSLSYSDRFAGDNAAADGAVRAKTGWIDTGYTLAGVVTAADGTELTFAVYALGDVSDSAKTAIDTLVTGVYRCGSSLSDS
ncbi:MULTISPECIES: D-alanyl-D-alanine carboxypeptidase/D-alanyl-D-alanine-endopeptidase [unclassified Rathayibacter]|jgi:D-alanyl-D-alanine carboxypeptidase/D-alanyl-D-alanine-endopeptidase (penicillin-binding protein 4)|uniref:D-alanyl-D-alanine carboxypeptidase/D-alanyl-D-alanine endopeptidase n=1 Tax=unclassified Rathayibacter TaxID=2609250 RepID=UPI000CE896A5|nr:MULTISPECIES: D-alanyl-D-alanine carboxypeptidase/D-alanyl-D-alanine-endopeptidase [unclassified Rathayibacter]PPF50667.1 D-alanyl-D-alanine carboxypeptidase/D-alanyl-D-alanine-endopeptidase [Rathayibacter sp. AY1A1]PPG85476.1 D-alanyl-D-alanine carboxypeptidase/D-alanyl-D-alanine-endopeptidase [Rathayibacter sp. AY1H2]PPG98903.1 D-alanyl-D-alanine carboxypeptidase/D-alanyl-D-alanine-endopeptidase [Rathayibacter sp. AY1G9]